MSSSRPDVQVWVGREAVQSVAAEWRALWEVTPDATAPQHPTIALGLGEVLQLPGDPVLVTVRDSVGGGLLGALPLRRIGTGWRRRPFRIAGPVAGWHLPTTDPLVAPEQGTTVLPALTTALTETMPWEQLDLRFLPAGGALAQALPGVHSPSGAARVLPLAAGPQFTGSGATRMRQYARRLERRGHSELLPAAPATAVAEVVARFAALHSARWADAGEAAEFRDPDTAARLVAWAVAAHAEGLLTVGAIRLDGHVIAAHLALNDRHGRTAWRIANSPDFPDVSLGRLLFSCMIDQAHADGCAWYAFGRGEEAYKQSWATQAEPLTRLVHTANRPDARLRRLGARLLRHRSARA